MCLWEEGLLQYAIYEWSQRNAEQYGFFFFSFLHWEKAIWLHKIDEAVENNRPRAYTSLHHNNNNNKRKNEISYVKRNGCGYYLHQPVCGVDGVCCRLCLFLPFANSANNIIHTKYFVCRYIWVYMRCML